MQRENSVKIEKVSIGKFSAQYCLTPTFRDRLNRNLTLLHRLEDLITDLEFLYQYAREKIEVKEPTSSETTKGKKISTYEQKDPRKVNFRIPKVKKKVEITPSSQARNPAYLDFLYRP
jgi:hypothetical protein